METNTPTSMGTTPQLSLLSLVRHVASDAASPTDADDCLRRLRAGLIRLGFDRAGIWVTDAADDSVLHGSWGTDWNGRELDEHGLTTDILSFVGAAQILHGDHVALSRVGRAPDDATVHRPLVRLDGSPNRACVALRADDQMMAIISVDMLPSDRTIDSEHVAALEVVADYVAVAIARGNAMSALRAELAERRAAEESLRWSEERQRSLFDGVPVGLYRTSAEGEIIDVNAALIELLGYADLADLKAVDVQHTFVNPDDRAHYQAILDRDGIVQRFEMQLRRRDGVIIWVEDTGRIVRNPDGSVRFYEGTMQDVSDRKRAEAALRESEGRLRYMVEHSGDVMYRLRYDTMRYDYMSPLIVTLTGYTVDEIHQIGWDAIVEKRMTLQGLAVTPEDLRLQRLPENVGPFHADYLIRTKSGTHRWLTDHSDPWHDHDGTLIGSIGLLSDITERKLLEDRLRQAQKMEAIGMLAGGVAHDFNNLLTVINGYADLLLGQSTSGTFPFDAATQILHAGESAAKLTGHLLAFSRKQIFAPQKINLNSLLDRTTQILGRTIGEDIRFATVLAPDLGSIMADPGQIEQVVMTLVSNAREAMPRGGKLTIQTSNVVLDATYVRFHPEAKPGPHVMLAVGDTGRGMDAATRARIFEPFFTTKDERTVGKGAGLGLAAVYGIVEQCGGVIDVYSEPGIGTTFNLYFPRIDLPALVANANVDQEDLPRGTETIMVIEDERQVRTLARRLLESSGYTVIEADGGDQALSLVAKRVDPIAILLSDVVMPGMSGPKLVDELSKRFRDLKVIYMSGFTDDMMVRHGLVSESVNFLQKPFTRAALARKVRAVLDG